MKLHFAILISLSMLLQATLSGNVLCLGEKGHVAIEPPHLEPPHKALSIRLTPVATCGGLGAAVLTLDHHGPCDDLGANSETNASHGAPVAQTAPSVPVPHAALPEISIVIVTPVLASHHIESQSAPPPAAVAHNAVLLI